MSEYEKTSIGTREKNSLSAQLSNLNIVLYIYIYVTIYK